MSEIAETVQARRRRTIHEYQDNCLRTLLLQDNFEQSEEERLLAMHLVFLTFFTGPSWIGVGQKMTSLGYEMSD